MSGKSKRRRLAKEWRAHLKYITWHAAFVAEHGYEPSFNDRMKHLYQDWACEVASTMLDFLPKDDAFLAERTQDCSGLK